MVSGMKRGLLLFVCSGAFAFAVVGTAAADTVGSAPMLRAAASTVITAELQHDGSAACGKLYAPLAATIDGKTCAQRWDARSARLLSEPGGARRLRADLRAVATAAVTYRGPYASIALPDPLLGGKTRFYWTANCWMLMN